MINDSERKARAERARTYRDEFMAPILDGLIAEYRQRMVTVATTELDAKTRADKITALSFALKLTENITSALDAAVADGKVAEKSILRSEKLEKMSVHERRLFGIVPV